jgi:hypothetical protein
MKLLLLLSSAILLVLGVGGSALGAPPETCSSGAITGTHGSITVTGTCTFSGTTVTINGDLRVAKGAILNDHAGSSTIVTITGNVKVDKGAVLGLGYGPEEATPAFVGGSLHANDALTLYLGHVTVGGNLISNGGGAPDRNFPIKDNTIGGNLILQGWSGLWMGSIRNNVGGNVNVSKNTAFDTSEVPGIDSTEVQTNVIAGNLICHHNTPAAQVNILDGGEPNTVGGNSVRECPPRLVSIPTS